MCTRYIKVLSMQCKRHFLRMTQKNTGSLHSCLTRHQVLGFCCFLVQHLRRQLPRQLVMRLRLIQATTSRQHVQLLYLRVWVLLAYNFHRLSVTHLILRLRFPTLRVERSGTLGGRRRRGTRLRRRRDGRDADRRPLGHGRVLGPALLLRNLVGFTAASPSVALNLP